jgi:hypothetical protein
MRLVACVLIVFSACASHAADQESPQAVQWPPESLIATAWYFGYPGGMLFRTAFHRGYTTRIVLLKTAVRWEELADYLSLTEAQIKHIRDLPPLAQSDHDRDHTLDLNAEPDEQLLEPEYFAFLSTSQLAKLDRVAFRFDGYIALTRRSLAGHLNISQSTQIRIREAVRAVRENVVLPRARGVFAAPLPGDIEFRNCLFAGSVCAQLNVQIIEIMTPEECQRVSEFISPIRGDKMIAELEKLAPLPEGVYALSAGMHP